MAKKIVSANHVKDLHEEFNHSIICENFKNSKDCKSVTELSASSRLAVILESVGPFFVSN